MIALEKTIETSRPVGQVFRYVSDFANIDQWDPGVVNSRRTSSGGVKENATFDLTLSYGFGKISMTYRMVEFVPNQKVVLTGRGKSFTATDTLEFFPAGRGTEMRTRRPCIAPSAASFSTLTIRAPPIGSNPTDASHGARDEASHWTVTAFAPLSGASSAAHTCPGAAATQKATATHAAAATAPAREGFLRPGF